MSNSIDPIPRWTRAIANLRGQALKRRRRSAQLDGDDLSDEALLVCDSLLQELAGAHLEHERLRTALHAEREAWEFLFDVMPTACLLTDDAGCIVSANRAAGALLNVATRFLKDRPLLVFFEDREAFSHVLHLLPRSRVEHRRTLKVRPRERRPTEMDIVAVRQSDGSELWLWFLCPTATILSFADRSEVLRPQELLP